MVDSEWSCDLVLCCCLRYVAGHSHPGIFLQKPLYLRNFHIHDSTTDNNTAAMTSSTKPTVVLLQGSFQLPEVYHKFAGIIESRGFPVVQPPFPSLTDQDDPDFTKRTLADDAWAVEAVTNKLVAREGRTVLVLMHSYGGLVGAEAVPEDLTLRDRKGRGLPGGVARLFYCMAGSRCATRWRPCTTICPRTRRRAGPGG